MNFALYKTKPLHLTFIVTVCCLWLGLSTVTQAQAHVTSESQEVVLREGLVIDGIGQYGRSPVHRDVLEALMLSGQWAEPHEGAPLVNADGRTCTWRKISADEQDWFSAQGRGGYLYVRVDSDSERIMLLHMKGNSMAYVNGIPRIGSRYQYKDRGEAWEPHFDYVRLPIVLHKGRNDLLFNRAWRSGGRVKARLLQPTAEVMFNTDDTTLPDLVTGQTLRTHGSVVVINASDRIQRDLALTVAWPDRPTTLIKLPVIQPCTVRKVAFPLQCEAPAPEQTGTQSIQLAVFHENNGPFTPLDQCVLNLDLRQPDEAYKRTFVSDIDGSVQYYAVNPVTPLPGDTSPAALVLSVHGAGVEAINQARSYASKNWCNVVSPTNRRPYGFDWEDWGRLDALEVLDDAKASLGFDPERVYLTGHSMGGHGAWILGSTYPDRFAAIGPSAGWLSFWSYRGAKKASDPSPIEALLGRAESAGDTMTLVKNLPARGIYILHGGADDNVRPDQSRMMIEHLETFHHDFIYHEEPNQGHWWDLSDEPGSDCVDWAPMFDFFARHSLPPDKTVRQVDFVTVNPGISAWCHWAGIEDQIEPLELSSLRIRLDPGQRRFVGTTQNVARLCLKLDTLPGTAPLTVTLDNQTLTDIPYPTKDRSIRLTQIDGQWCLAEKAAPRLKGPYRYGPFKAAFNHHMIFVYGTQGNPEENQWAQTKARFDAEQWWYQGNGNVDVMADVDFDPDEKSDCGVILYGHATTNLAWEPLLGSSPVQVIPGTVIIGQRKVQGDNLACLFLRPRPGNDNACVAAVSGTGSAGMQLTSRLQYIFAGCNYPDCIVIGPEMLTKGADGIRVAGLFGSDWGVESGHFAWSKPIQADSEETASQDLPAYIGPDPRPFVMPRHYVCQKTSDPISVDGKLDEPSWQQAAWTEPFVDIEGCMRPVVPKLTTRAKMLWDDQYFYIGAQLEEPHVWGTITERNAVIFHDNDFEVFIDPDGDNHHYVEFEMNALNTVWNLVMDKPYKNGGSATNIDMPGQQSGVYVQGTLNEPSDEDRYWSVEIAFPFQALAERTNIAFAPQKHPQWRINFSRVQWGHKVMDGGYQRVPSKTERTDTWHEDNWVWSPQGVVNMHRPETWGIVQFSESPVGTAFTPYKDPTMEARYLLHHILYRQEQYKQRRGHYAATLAQLDLESLSDQSITLQTSKQGWQAKIALNSNEALQQLLTLRQDGKIEVE